MALASTSVTNHILTVNLLRPRRGRIIGRNLVRLSVVAKDAGPLLNGLIVVLAAERRVRIAVENLDARSAAVIAGVHVEGDLRPLVLRVDEGAARALAVPAVDGAGVEAACRDAGVDGRGLEEIGVCSREDILLPIALGCLSRTSGVYLQSS